MSRSIGSFLAQKVVIALVLFLLAPLMWSVLRLAGAPLPVAIPLVVAALLGLLGFFLPDIALRSEAEKPPRLPARGGRLPRLGRDESRRRARTARACSLPPPSASTGHSFGSGKRSPMLD